MFSQFIFFALDLNDIVGTSSHQHYGKGLNDIANRKNFGTIQSSDCSPEVGLLKVTDFFIEKLRFLHRCL